MFVNKKDSITTDMVVLLITLHPFINSPKKIQALTGVFN